MISSHHGLFFNVLCNELQEAAAQKYFLQSRPHAGQLCLQRDTDDTPFFHHVAMLRELHQAAESGELYTHHFNMLRSILEKTATFYGFGQFLRLHYTAMDDDGMLHARGSSTS